MKKPVDRNATGIVALVIGGTALALWIVALVISVVALALWLPAQLPPVGSRMDRVDLAPDVLVHGTVSTRAESSVEYAIDVPADAIALDIEAVCTDADVDLYVWHDDQNEEDAAAALATDFTETLRISAFSDPPLQQGRYTVQVYYAGLFSLQQHDRVAYTIEATLLRRPEPIALEPGRARAARLEPRHAGVASFRMDVPEHAPALRIDLTDARNDLDIFARRGRPLRSLDDVEHLSELPLGRESLVITRQSEPPLSSGTWFVDIADVMMQQIDRPADFTILVTLNADPPDSILAIPQLARPVERLLDRPLGAVVEVLCPEGSGSGALLTRDGLLLTNDHVIRNSDGEACDDIVIAVTLDERRPAIEMFRARVAAADEDLDLALLEVTSGLYHQPIPEGYVFPAIEVGSVDVLRIGDPLYVVGYGSTGGTGSRVSITCVTGIVSGWEETDLGMILKTDATIADGMSGGAALDAEGRLIGTPTSVVIESDGAQMAYVHPVNLFPRQWRDILKERMSREAYHRPGR